VADGTYDTLLTMQLTSIITCPSCGHSAAEVIPTDACLYFYECGRYGERLRPKPGRLLRLLLVRFTAVPADSSSARQRRRPLLQLGRHETSAHKCTRERPMIRCYPIGVLMPFRIALLTDEIESAVGAERTRRPSSLIVCL
jgi:hypothetical protein